MIANILEHFSTLPDPRRDHSSKLHALIDIVVIALCGVLAKCETWEDIVDYVLDRTAPNRPIRAEEKREFLKTFLALEGGIPSHDTLNRTSLIDPMLWQSHFIAWMQTLTAESLDKIKRIQIDGKVLRGSKSSGTGKHRKQTQETAVEMVSAWSSEHQLVIGHVTVDRVSNEIKAVPVLLEQLDLEGTLVSLDAMGGVSKGNYRLNY